MKDKLITVIVPVYNVEQYVARCIDSISNQTYKNLEIILVDDGSKDSSGIICEDYAKKDSRIKVIHTKNGGVSNARNAGLDIATGDFIAFVDSDDYILANMYETMLQELLNNEADIAICQIINTFGECPEIANGYNSINLTKNDLLERFYVTKKNFVTDYSPCNKLYKKGIINNVRFESGRIYEDILFNYHLMHNAVKGVYIPVDFYCYYQRAGSSSDLKKKVTKKQLDLIYNWNKILEDGKDKLYEKNIKYWLAKAHYVILLRASIYGVADSFSDYDIIKKELLKFYRKNCWRLLIGKNMSLSKKIGAFVLFVNYNLSGLIGRKFLR